MLNISLNPCYHAGLIEFYSGVDSPVKPSFYTNSRQEPCFLQSSVRRRGFYRENHPRIYFVFWIRTIDHDRERLNETN